MIAGFLFGLGIIAALIFVANIEWIIIGAVCLAALAVVCSVADSIPIAGQYAIIAGVVAWVLWKWKRGNNKLTFKPYNDTDLDLRPIITDKKGYRR